MAKGSGQHPPPHAYTPALPVFRGGWEGARGIYRGQTIKKQAPISTYMHVSCLYVHA